MADNRYGERGYGECGCGDCGCGDDASCYGCLRSYRNQFAHPDLKRGPTTQYLDRVIRAWPDRP